MAAKKHPDREPYVNVPRSLDKQPAYRALSRDAQWLLQHLERDPFRLNCGVFVMNLTMVAKSAKATVAEVQAWYDELIGAGWVVEDEDEAWLTQHIEWDFPLATPNQAKGLLRDTKRVTSERFGKAIVAQVLDVYPELAEGYGIDPDWINPSGGPFDESDEGPSEGLSGGSADPQSLIPVPKPEERSLENEERGPKKAARSPQTAANAGSTKPGPCATCDDNGVHDAGHGCEPCPDCDYGKATKAKLDAA